MCVLPLIVLLFPISFSVETLEPDVKILSLAILCPGRHDIVLQIPEGANPKGVWFTLKEGTHYRLRFSIQVNNNIVSGLRYTNTIWKTGLKGTLSLSNKFQSFELVYIYVTWTLLFFPSTRVQVI